MVAQDKLCVTVKMFLNCDVENVVNAKHNADLDCVQVQIYRNDKTGARTQNR